jgi:hypothetical protein
MRFSEARNEGNSNVFPIAFSHGKGFPILQSDAKTFQTLPVFNHLVLVQQLVQQELT